MATKQSASFEQLVDWVEGRLSDQEATEVTAMVRDDPVAQANVAWLRDFARMREGIVLQQPPLQVSKALHRQFTTGSQAKQPGFFERLVAALTFDSGFASAVAGVRSASDGAALRQFIFEVELGEIALNVQLLAPDGPLSLTGQLYLDETRAPGSFAAQLLRDAQEVGITAPDDLGEFAFAPVHPGSYELILSADNMEIVVGPFALQL